MSARYHEVGDRVTLMWRGRSRVAFVTKVNPSTVDVNLVVNEATGRYGVLRRPHADVAYDVSTQMAGGFKRWAGEAE